MTIERNHIVQRGTAASFVKPERDGVASTLNSVDDPVRAARCQMTHGIAFAETHEHHARGVRKPFVGDLARKHELPTLAMRHCMRENDVKNIARFRGRSNCHGDLSLRWCCGLEDRSILRSGRCAGEGK